MNKKNWVLADETTREVSNKKFPALLVSMISFIVIAVCAFMIVGGTYALFTDKIEMNTHIYAGDLEVTLERTKLTQNLLDQKGYLDEVVVMDIAEGDEPDDFTTHTTKNVFGLDSSTIKFVPQAWAQANMRITNGSDVAFGYWITIVFDDAADLQFADQLKVTIVAENGKTVSQYLSEGVDLGSRTNFIDVAEVGDVQTFTVKVEFIDDLIFDEDDPDKFINNDAMNQDLEFDLVLNAIQVVAPQP